MTEHVILVDQNDQAIGTCEKLQAHVDGVLHRALSIFIFNEQGELLLQQRALHKYHAGGLWSNTCCTHPRPGEAVAEATHRRLQEEMGFACPLVKLFTFTYRAELDNDLIEHEYDHVFAGRYDGDPEPNAEEVEDWKWIDVQFLLEDLDKRPQVYTPWFRMSLKSVLSAFG